MLGCAWFLAGTIRAQIRGPQATNGDISKPDRIAQSARSKPTPFGRSALSSNNGHAVYDIRYHVISITEYRYQVPSGRMAERARDIIRQICQAREVVIV